MFEGSPLELPKVGALMERDSHESAPEVFPMAVVERERVGERKLSGITWAAIALVVIGALNWGLVGLFNYDLVAAIFGHFTALSRIIYTLVAIAGLYLVVDAARLREETGHHALKMT